MTVLTLLGSIALGWSIMNMNVTLLIWAGVGGFTAAMMGPLVFGSLWGGVTKTSALAGFWAGAISFILIHGEIISGHWLTGTALEDFGNWFAFYAKSPYSAASIGGALSVITCFIVSRLTEPLSVEHLQQVRGS